MSGTVLAYSDNKDTNTDGDCAIERARILVPRLVERSSDARKARAIPKETIDEIKDLGLMRLLQPKKFGGAEGKYSTFMKVTEELAKGCASTAWVYAVFTEHMWVIASFPEQAQIEVWGTDSTAAASSSFVPRATAIRCSDGFKLSGKWPFSSGCDHAQWIVLGAFVEEADGRRRIYDILVPRADVQILDDWHVFGLVATGSKSVILEDVFIPMHRAIPHDDVLEGSVPGVHVHPNYPLVGAPRRSFSFYSLPPIMLALADKAFAIVTSSLQGRISNVTKMANLEMVQVRLAETGAEIDAVRGMLAAGCLEAERDLMNAESTIETALRHRRDVVFGMRRLRFSVEALCDLAGASWVYDGHPLQTVLRDVITASMHRSANWEGAAIPYGRMVLGLDADGSNI